MSYSSHTHIGTFRGVNTSLDNVSSMEKVRKPGSLRAES